MPKIPLRRQNARHQRRIRKSGDDYLRESKLGAEGEGSDSTNLVLEHSQQLQKFLNWAGQNGIVLHNKVRCTSDGVSANYGMIATDDIKKGENVFILPRPATLSPTNCAIAEFLKENDDRLQSHSGWLPLILALMYEKLNPDSRWRAYLDTFPNFDDVELPMFWLLSELDSELEGTGMVKSVSTDIQNMRKEYETSILPLIKENPKIFQDPKFQEFQFVKQICAFIMAYSFTDDITPSPDLEMDSDSERDSEDGEPLAKPATIMVPMADLLNHVPKHNAELNVGESTFRMIAVRDIEKGEEVYNTYGKVSNYTLLLMYGFAVKPQDNPYDTVELRLPVIKQACLESKFPDVELRIEWITRRLATEFSADEDTLPADAIQKLVDDQSICVHPEGLFDTSDILKVLRMDKDELQAKLDALGKKGETSQNGMEEDEDWMSDDEEGDEISIEAAKKLDDESRAMLLRAADLMLAKFPTGHQSDSIAGDSSELSKRQLYAGYVRDSQILLLRKLKQWVTWYD